MRFLLLLLINGLIIYFVSEVLVGVRVDSYLDAVLVALALALVNFFLRPILVLLTLPITVITLGLFLIVLNGIMVLIVDALLSGFEVAGLAYAILFALVMGLINTFIVNFNTTENRTA